MKRILLNGKIFTGEKFVSAMEITDDHVSWLGDSRSARLRHADEVVNLNGRLALPSFWDVHTHPLWISETLGSIACTPPNVASIEEMIKALRNSSQVGKKDAWIEGWGYDESKLAEGRTPTLADLDKVSTTQPVYVLRSDCHSCVVNSVALKLAGITADTPNPVGGMIGHFANGEPNGVMLENGASKLIKEVKEKDTFENMVNQTLRLTTHYRQRGIGVISDMISLVEPYDYAKIYAEAARRGLLQDVYLYYSIDEIKRLKLSCLPRSSHPRIHVAGIKLFMDGTISNQTARVKKPYKNATTTGFAINTVEDLKFAYEFAKANECQIAIHAMGDAAIQLILDTYGNLEPWLMNRPSVRIEHATILDDKLLKQFHDAKMNFAFVTQIIFLYAEYASYFQNLDEKRLKQCYPLASMLQSGVPTALSSDAPATAWIKPDDVFASLACAVTRVGANGEDLNHNEAIDFITAFSLYTKSAAGMVPTDKTAMLTVGQSADLIVLSQDLFVTSPEKWQETTIEKMYLRGTEIKEEIEVQDGRNY